MLGSSKPKKKKSIDYEEEEKMKNLLKKPVDATTLANEKLRPWTVNPSAEGVLRTELGKLDKTIVITSPQMSAGDIGFSVLDRKLPAIDEFKNSLKTRAKLNPYRSVYEDYIQEYQKKFQKNPSQPRNSGNRSNNGSGQGRNGNHSQAINSGELVPQGMSEMKNDDSFMNHTTSSYSFQASTKYLPPSQSGNDDIISEVDTDHVTKIQRMIGAKSLSSQHSITMPLPTVQYRPFKSPAVFPVSTSEYQKFKHEIKSFPKPTASTLHLNHRNQLLMMSIVSNQHPDLFHTRRRVRRTQTLSQTKSAPDINSSYYHFPPPGTS